MDGNDIKKLLNESEKNSYTLRQSKGLKNLTLLFKWLRIIVRKIYI